MAKDPQARPDAEAARQLLTAVAESTGDEDTTVLCPGSRPAPAVPPVHGTPTAGAGAFPATPFGTPGGPPTPPGPFGARDGDPPHGSDTPLVTPVPDAPEPPRKRRALLVAAAVLAVLAAGGGGYALLAGGDRVEAGRAVAPGASTSASKEAGSSPPADPKPTEEGGKPESLSGDPSGGEDKPGEEASKPAGGGTIGGGTDGGSVSGGSTGGTSSSAGGSGGSGTSGSSGGGEEPVPACHPAGGGKYDCDAWRTADSYTASGTKVGVLNKGTNYFYCQQNLGRCETYQGGTNVWWAKTDDDRGNTNVFVSDVYLKGGENDKPLPGLLTRAPGPHADRARDWG